MHWIRPHKRLAKKRKSKNWTQRVFLSTLILSHCLFPARPFLAADTELGKSYSPSQGVKEKAANQLNRSWNLFIWKSLFLSVTWGTSQCSEIHFWHHLAAGPISSSMIHPLGYVFNIRKWAFKCQTHFVGGGGEVEDIPSGLAGLCTNCVHQMAPRASLPMELPRQSTLTATSNYYLIVCSSTSWKHPRRNQLQQGQL